MRQSLFVGAATSISDLAPPGRGAEAASYFSVAVFGGLGIGPVISESVIGSDRFDAGAVGCHRLRLAGGGTGHADARRESGTTTTAANAVHAFIGRPSRRVGAGARCGRVRDVQRVHARLLRDGRARWVEVGVRHLRRRVPGDPRRCSGDRPRPHRSCPRCQHRHDVVGGGTRDVVPVAEARSASLSARSSWASASRSTIRR